MTLETPPIRQRGIRGFALKHLTKAHFTAPQQHRFPIPKWQMFSLGGGVVGTLTPPKVSKVSLDEWQIVAFDSAVVFRASTISLACLFLLPQVTDDLSLWEVTARQIDIASFVINVFGKRYRLAVQEAEQEAKAKQPSLFTEPAPAPPSEIPPQAKPLYAYLYDLLYPPPDEEASQNLPHFDSLYDYQKAGVNFLIQREHALLADDMGLGKTAQCSIAIAILRKSERVGRTLIICPRAVVQQWKTEALKWGNVRATAVDGTPAERALTWEYNPGVLLATPHIVEKDADAIAKQSFDLVVCDDVSMLKNPAAKITKAIRGVSRKRSWCLNGTPMENKPEDFTNVMEFAHPGLFSSTERAYAPSSLVVKKRVAPYFLRRTKKQCLKDLRPKSVFDPVRLQMSPEQWDTYRFIEQREWNEFQKVGTKAGKVHIFAIIIRLIQICNYDLASGQSAKADALAQQLAQILTLQEPDVKAIVFSRFVKTLEFLAERFAIHKPILYHGGLSDQQRDMTLKQFRKEGRLLLMSTKSGARGINLQEANHVFHFDRTYNPVDALQGEDRCWRLGQKREVFVNRYLQVGTIEERIDKILQNKKNLIDDYVESMADDSDDEVERIISEKWRIEELIEMLRPSTPALTE